MKEGWTYKKLGDLCKIRTGKLDANAADDNGLYPFFTCSITPLKINTFAYDCECVLVAGNGDLNVKYFSGKFNAYQRTYIIESNDKNVLDVKYLYLFLSEYVTILRKKSIGAIIKYIKLGYLTDAKIPLPPLTEQQSIVDYFDSAFAKIDAMKANAEKALNEAKALFQASLKEMLEPQKGWEEKTLGDVCVKSKNIRWEEFQDGKLFTYIDLTSVDRETLTIVEPQIINKKNAPSRAKQIVKSGDIIFATTRPTLRRVCLISEDFDNQICSTGFCVLRPKEDVISKWIFFSLLNEDFYKYIEPLQTGASYPAVTDGIVKNYLISYPSLRTDQQQIISQLDSLKSKVDRLQENFDKISQECDALKQAILRQVFE